MKGTAMTLNDLIKSQFDGFSPPPIRYSASTAHLYADYLELLTVLQAREWFTASDLVKRFKDERITVVASSMERAGKSDAGECFPAEIEDEYDRWAHQVFLQVQDRDSLLQADYPFEIEADRVRTKSDLTKRQKVYIMLLLCSNLHFVQKLQSVLTRDFECIAAEVLRKFLPSHAVVKKFGSDTDYKGSAEDKIWSLAMDMDLDVNDEEVSKVDGNQDRGLDVVAWMPFRDGYPNFIAILGQCACGKQWYSKLSETRRYEHSYLNFRKAKPIHAIFVPRYLHFRDDLYQSDELSDVLLFERLRIVQFLQDCEFFSSYDSSKIVDHYIALVEDLV